MIRIENLAPTPDRVSLGEIVEFRLLRDVPAVETRCFLKQQRVFYLKPLGAWSTSDRLRLFAEAPGAYSLLVQWRGPGGRRGSESADFEVVSRRRLAERPFRIRLDKATQIWAPSRWDALEIKKAERAVLELLPEMVAPGAVVYDVGANLGVYSIPLARLAGRRGSIYCIEPNPVCVHFLRINLLANQLENFEIIPTALLDRSGEVKLVLNYGNANLGTTEATEFYALKAGHEIGVQCVTLDDLIESFDLRSPDFVKIDVEGVEARVVQGMAKTLATSRPMLLLELHGLGATAHTVEHLDRADYVYRTPDGRRQFATGREVWEHFGEAVFQLVAVPRERRGRRP